MPWDAITYVSSGLTLVAFVVATGAWIIKIQAEEKRKLIESARDESQVNLVDKALDLVHVDTAGISEENKYNLAMELIRRRAERFKIVAIIVCVFAVSGSGVAIYSNYQIPVSNNHLTIFIREVHKLQTVAAAMSSGPLEKVRDVSSKAPKLANDILGVDGVQKLSHKIDQNRYAATAFLFASDASELSRDRIKYAEKVISLVSKGLELVIVAKKTNVSLSKKLSDLSYADKLRHLYLDAVLTLVISGMKEYQHKYELVVDGIDREYFRRNIGENYRTAREDQLSKIQKLWEQH